MRTVCASRGSTFSAIACWNKHARQWLRQHASAKWKGNGPGMLPRELLDRRALSTHRCGRNRSRSQTKSLAPPLTHCQERAVTKGKGRGGCKAEVRGPTRFVPQLGRSPATRNAHRPCSLGTAGPTLRSHRLEKCNPALSAEPAVGARLRMCIGREHGRCKAFGRGGGRPRPPRLQSARGACGRDHGSHCTPERPDLRMQRGASAFGGAARCWEASRRLGGRLAVKELQAMR